MSLIVSIIAAVPLNTVLSTLKAAHGYGPHISNVMDCNQQELAEGAKRGSGDSRVSLFGGTTKIILASDSVQQSPGVGYHTQLNM